MARESDQSDSLGLIPSVLIILIILGLAVWVFGVHKFSW